MSDKDDKKADEASEERRAKLVKAGVAVGIGSAAIVAALPRSVKRGPSTVIWFSWQYSGLS